MNEVATLPARFKLSVDAYERMIEVGIFGEEDRVELIDGELIDTAPIGDPHIANVASLNEAVFIACQGRATVFVQSLVWGGERSMPGRTVDAYREPEGDTYAETTTYRAGDQIALALAPKIVVKLGRVFP